MSELDNLKPIPVKFLLAQTDFTWREIVWGYERGWLGWRSLVDLACSSAMSRRDRVDTLTRLEKVGKGNSHEAAELARELASREPSQTPSDIQNKWLYIVLRSLHSRRNEFSDPWLIIEEIYAEFDYPQAMRRFVPFVPVVPEDKPEWSTYANPRDFLLEQWKKFLLESSARYDRRAK